ncbi:sensor histidine kinase [Dinghuibacter silviterrae]|uniref:GHKL domain-containing protein n=1 Tax=Dinghuibacter silviterrae TaxID=1539049 RepID=A0A4R8DV28_9BACT|nr:histidine kinase [Dinghuibacter silviterrae]TDX01267.1 GHKL domain-containing protein [Dinghuibacter silviterrae]
MNDNGTKREAPVKRAWYERRWIQVGLHTAFWAGLMVLPHLLIYQGTKEVSKASEPPTPTGVFPTILELLSYGFFIGLFYVNGSILTRRFLYTRRYWLYFTIVLGILCAKVLVFYPLSQAAHDAFKPSFLTYLISNFLVLLFFLALSTAYQVIGDKVRSDKLTQDRQEEHLKTELSFLRSQISPHFMFNVLNNIVALVRMKSDKLEPTIFKLSSLMRYMLYQADDQKISLQKEADYLQSYIDLQQMRVGDKVRLHVSIKPGTDLFTIEPMLLIPFIENAFKHGTGYMEHPQIDIHLSVTDGLLYFTVRNRFNPQQETKDATSGIGLANVKRRLNLLYGNEYDLWITTKNDWFLVSLQLNLQYVAVHSGR